MGAILAAIAIAAPLLRTTAWAAARQGRSNADSKDDPQSAGPFQRLCKAYLDGTWTDLEKDLQAGKEPPGLTAEQRLELAAMRSALAEGRPAWWQSCKAGLGGQIHPVVWGRKLDMAYDPKGKQSVQMTFTGNRISLAVAWPPAEMDNGENTGHGFSKGDLNDLSIWCIMGTALTWTQVSPQSLGSLGEKEKSGLLRFQDFRAEVTGLYYSTPKARRWGEILYLLAWKEMYAAMPIVNARKANGAMFLVEVLTDPAKYPSLPAPADAPAENTEEKLAEQYRDWIQKHGWTVAEDMALRKAIQGFAAANDDATLLRTKQLVTLPNKLKISLDPAEDESLRPLRDAWLKKQLDKAISPRGK
jgi:hypothetical protein